jgi:hypothetical protein
VPYGIDTADISISNIPTWVWLLVLIVGLLLCFFGEIIWEFMISILGAIIGSMIGFAIGYALGGYLCGFGLMFICAIIGSMIFQYLAKTAVALLLAVLAFAAAAYLVYNSNPDDLNTPVIVGIVVGVIVFVIAIMYVEEIISVFLAAIGGLLIGVAVYFLVGGDYAVIYAGLAGGAMFAMGAAFQVMYQRERKGRGRPPPRREPVRRTQPVTKTPAQQPPTQKSPVQKPPTQKPPSQQRLEKLKPPDSDL